MEVHIIDDLKKIDDLRSEWERVYQADTHAQFFVSWVWISGHLKRSSNLGVSWFVLAAKSDSCEEYVAFFPVYISIEHDEKAGLYSRLKMAGVTDSHHQGFICIPEYEKDVAIAYAAYLETQEIWSVFELQHIQTNSSRLNLFLSCFSESNINIIDVSEVYKNELDNVDNSICPYISLPNDWEQYLQSLGPSTRKNIRKKIKRFSSSSEDSNSFYITHVNEENIENHLGILFRLWQSNWQGRKGEQHCSKVINFMHFFFRYCFEYHCLYLPILWHGDQPVGAIAHFIDVHSKSLLSFVSARDETFTDLPPGLILHAEAIRYAIQNGLQTYDFLMGNEEYKYSFGAQERYIKTVMVQRKDWINQDITLNLRTIPQAIQLAEKYHRANRLTEAKEGYSRILTTCVDQPDALYGLAVVMQREKSYQAAEDLLKRLLQIQPNNAKAWFSLGTVYQMQDQFILAVDSYQQALNVQPQIEVVALATYHNLGYTLQQQGKLDEAIACYQKARELQPNSVEVEVVWANALHTQGRLSLEEQAHYGKLNHELGNKRRQANDLNAAIDYYQQAIAMNPALAEAHYQLGVLLQDQGNREKAITCYQNAQKLQPEYVEAAVGLANLLYVQGELSPNDQTHYAAMNYELGNQHRRNKNLKMAIQYYRQAIAMNPALAEAHHHLGLALQIQGSGEEAIAAVKKALELRPNYLEAEINLANILYAQNKLASESLVHYAEMNIHLGHQRKQMNDLMGAIGYYRQALLMNPELSEVREHLRLAIQEQDNIKVKVSVAKQ